MKKDEDKYEATQRKRGNLNMETMSAGKSLRRMTVIAQRLPGVEEESEAEIDDSDVESEETSDDVISNDEDWSDEKDIASEIEEDKKRRNERRREYGDYFISSGADGN